MSLHQMFYKSVSKYFVRPKAWSTARFMDLLLGVGVEWISEDTYRWEKHTNGENYNMIRKWKFDISIALLK